VELIKEVSKGRGRGGECGEKKVVEVVKVIEDFSELRW
jgi:hypothetical protein